MGGAVGKGPSFTGIWRRLGSIPAVKGGAARRWWLLVLSGLARRERGGGTGRWREWLAVPKAEERHGTESVGSRGLERQRLAALG